MDIRVIYIDLFFATNVKLTSGKLWYTFYYVLWINELVNRLYKL